ncbi:MAG: flagellar hook-associated protein FlgK [candidate division Zixibacteria bacterium]|nr:flagellar hook-associated protein FlgK [candidate division Zixibacteria bacterium]
MYGVNVGFEIAKRAVLSTQYGINITGHNVANVNTPGYTRQAVDFKSTPPLRAGMFYAGSGVDVGDIRRIRWAFLDTQMQKEKQELGQWENAEQIWSQVETIFNEPSDTGLSQALTDFWNAWSDLSDNPESSSAKTAVKESANVVISNFHGISSQLKDLRSSIDNDIQQTVTMINDYTRQVANLNSRIVNAEVSGAKANDLRDRRDYIVEQLAEFGNVRVREDDSGAIDLFFGSAVLVTRGDYLELDTETVVEDGFLSSNIVLSSVSYNLDISKGSLKSMMDARDTFIPDKLQKLDQLAAQLVESVNELHSSGYTTDGTTGIDFFSADGVTADSIGLSNEILTDAENIVVSEDGSGGDNTVALAIAELRNEKVMNDGTASLSGFYNSVISEIGSQAREASDMKTNHELMVNQLENRRQSISGVSLDEEMANLIAYENAYGAAAKVLDVMDSALDTIVNKL